MESHWTHKLHEIKGFPPLCRALREFPHLVDTSLYWKQISAYRAFFPDDQILVLFFEDFVRDPYGVLEACFRFLGVDPQVRVAEAERPRHVSAGFKRDKWWVPILQKFPGAKTVKTLAPRLAKRVMERFREPVDDQPEWDEATRRWAIEQVAEDSRTFLEFYGKPADYWKFTGAL